MNADPFHSMNIQKYWCIHKVNRTSSSGSYNDGGGSAPIYNMYSTLSSSFFIGHTSKHSMNSSISPTSAFNDR